MEKATEGMPALWYPYSETSSKPHVAWVTTVGRDGIVSLAILSPNSRGFMLKDGVRHKDDPACKKPELKEYGCWDYTQEHRDREVLVRRVNDMEAMVKELLKKKG